MKIQNKTLRAAVWLLLFSALSYGRASESSWQSAAGRLKTRWAADVSPKNAHQEYPRPQLVRKDWLNLNGLWDLAIVSKESGKPEAFQTQILVPFPVESALSGVMKMVSENERLWYRRTFEVPRKWDGKRILLNFGAVDFEATVWVNGKQVGQHRGGYDDFSFDITQVVFLKGPNEIVVSVWDPTDAGTQPRGKQVRKPHSIWYTPPSGIWQTVWLEPVSAVHIKSVKITPDVDKSAVTIQPITTPSLGNYSVEVTIRDGRRRVYQASMTPGGRLTLPVNGPRLWSPEDPHLYQLEARLKLGSSTIDKVQSYF